MLQDGHGRRFEYLRLSVTDVCNFRCTYCLPDGYQGPGMRGQLNLTEIENLLRGFAAEGTRKVRITGGEPTLRRDFCDIVSLCRATEGIEQVALTTNGRYLEQRIAQWQAAGITSLNVSIDSLDPRYFKLITGRDELRQILTGVERALALGLPVKINTVLMKDFAAAELADFLVWLKTTPVTLRFIELMQTGDNPALFRDQHVRGQALIDRLLAAGWQPLPRGKLDGPAQTFTHPDYAGRIGFIMPYSPNFCEGCNRLRVTSRGKLQLCLFADGGFDIRPWLQQAGQLPQLRQRLHQLLANKGPSHLLHDANPGGTRNLAMFGG